MKSIRELLNTEGVTLRSYAEGERRAACPKCALLKQRSDDDALAVKIDDKGFTAKCHRCDWRPFGFFSSPVPRPSSRALRPPTTTSASDHDKRKTESARRIWREAQPITKPGAA